MENNFYKVFRHALAFGALAMVLLTVMFWCGNIFSCAAGIVILTSCLIAAGLVAAVAMILMNRNYAKEAKEAADVELEKKLKAKKVDDPDPDKTIEDLNKRLSEKDKNIENLNKQLDMIKHEERMALIKKLGEGAPNAEIIELLESEYFKPVSNRP